ncbi:DUF3144 domain-containing protein [Stappia sp. TSB10GB4]|uniref:DUF3144 domain-containing protein n=1 Tax=Stappia sp. TSB10GB4 TaxID=2003584 RepID=UPI0016487204|nr:DUF3144 domain-containing protein [Stappia sp. TSB10GB4]
MTNRQDRRAGRATGTLDTTGFLQVAARFIDLANRENRKIAATDLQMAFLWAAARYNAHVAKAVIGVEDHEELVTQMVESYREMLRQNLADPELDPPAGSA